MDIKELRSNIKWWESKRWIYNLAVCLFGVVGIYDGLSRGHSSWTGADTLGILWWGLGTNILYSIGILLELFDWFYFKNQIGIKRFRLFFFIVGISFSCLWTLWCCWVYFAKPHLF